jgi:predicted PolB exonuclease-like 3'-5' exonuclease
MRSRLLDLETISHPDADQWLDPVECDPKLLEPIEPDSRLKDPAKVAANLADVERRRAERPAEIAASIAERTLERNERLGLDPDCNRIVALGFHDLGAGDPTVYLCSTEYEEREQLKMFWETYAKQETRLIGYNSFRFDLPVLVMRSLYLSVQHPVITFAPAWKSWPHVDLYEKLSLNGARDRRDVKGLRFYAKRFGLPIYDDITGADVAAMVAAGQWDKVHNHCLFDLDLTRALAERLGVLTPAGVAA